jgi:hypothetical protein
VRVLHDAIAVVNTVQQEIAIGMDDLVAQGRGDDKRPSVELRSRGGGDDRRHVALGAADLLKQLRTALGGGRGCELHIARRRLGSTRLSSRNSDTEAAYLLQRNLGRVRPWALISSEPVAQTERLRYVLAHGVKEGLVEKVTDWPGVHCAQALLTGEAVQDYWFDGTPEYTARRRGEDCGDPMRFATPEALILSPLPCWRHFSKEKRRDLVAGLIAEIEAEAAAHRQRTGSQVLGASAVCGQHPFDRPKKSKKSPAPLFHAASQAVRRELYEMYGWFVAAFRTASEKLRGGDR